ncbi:rCG20566, partial [Rattus norvegicus]
MEWLFPPLLQARLKLLLPPLDNGVSEFVPGLFVSTVLGTSILPQLLNTTGLPFCIKLIDQYTFLWCDTFLVNPIA